jgi:carboxypeptidase C (cathepsin A)
MRLLAAALLATAVAAQGSGTTFAKVSFPPSVVSPGSGAEAIQAFAGYIEVNASATSGCSGPSRRLFAWYIPAQDGSSPSETGTFLWLQGGPGAPGVFGLLEENGPFTFTNGTTPLLTPREYSWTLHRGGLWVDQPLGTGFSVIPSDACLVNTSAQAAADLVDLLDQWAALFPEVLDGPFSVAGESYGGTYVPATAFALLQADSQRFPHASRLKLTGMIMGDPWSDPIPQMMAYGTLLRGFSIVDAEGALDVDALFGKAVSLVQQGTVQGRIGAFQIWDGFWGDYNPTGAQSGFQNVSGCVDTLNMERCRYPSSLGQYNGFVGQAAVQQALNVGSVSFGRNGGSVYRQFAQVSGDFMVGVRPQIEYVLDHGVRVLVYHGGEDAICGAVTGDALLRALEWGGAGAYLAAPRTPWFVNQSDADAAGYVKEAPGVSLSWAVLRNAGHLVPFDQPRAAAAMIDRFLANQPISASAP